MFLRLAFALIVLSVTTNGRTFVKRMTNADSGTITDFPYLVFIGNVNHVCNGVIVSKNYVLTAAHCIPDGPKLKIRSGSSFKHKGGSVHQIQNVTKHEKFYVTDGGVVSSDDIAVVQVQEPFVYDDTTQKIELNYWRRPQIDDEGEVVGFGRGSFVFDWPKQFRKLKVSITDTNKCNETHVSEGYIKEGQICAMSKNITSHTCFGDSGGPLVMENKLVGFSIYGGPCELVGSDDVYIDVAYYREWIDKHVVYDDNSQEGVWLGR